MVVCFVLTLAFGIAVVTMTPGKKTEAGTAAA